MPVNGAGIEKARPWSVRAKASRQFPLHPYRLFVHARGRAARRVSLADLGCPVDDDVERKLVGDDLWDDGEKPIAVRRYIKACPSLPVDREKRSWSSEHERRGSLYRHRHHADRE